MRFELAAVYRRRVRVALACAIVLHALLFVFLPPFQMSPTAVGAAPAPPDTVYLGPPDDYIPYDPPPEPTPPGDVKTWNPTPTPSDDPTVPAPPEPEPNRPSMPGLRPGGAPPPYTRYEREPELIEWESPHYPALAREAGIEGTVSVRVLVDELGRAAEAVVMSSDATAAMERAAIEAALRTRFRPALQQHVAVPAYVLIPYEFHLDR